MFNDADSLEETKARMKQYTYKDRVTKQLVNMYTKPYSKHDLLMTDIKNVFKQRGITPTLTQEAATLAIA